MHDKVGDEPSANGCMSQILLYFKFSFFALQLLSRELCPLPLDLRNTKILGSEGVDISYYSWISQVEESVVNNESVRSGGMEGGKVSVPWHATIEVGMGEGSSMKGGPVDGSVLCPSSL